MDVLASAAMLEGMVICESAGGDSSCNVAHCKEEEGQEIANRNRMNEVQTEWLQHLCFEL